MAVPPTVDREHESEILALYRCLRDTFDAALTEARAGGWDTAAEHGARAEAITRQLAGLESNDVVSAPAREQKAALASEALRLAEALRAVAEPAHAALAAQLGDNARHHKLIKAYGP